MKKILLYQILVFIIHEKKIKSIYNNDKFKISASIWNDKFELPDGSYCIVDIQDYLEYILKTHGENVDNPSVKYICKLN